MDELITPGAFVLDPSDSCLIREPSGFGSDRTSSEHRVKDIWVRLAGQFISEKSPVHSFHFKGRRFVSRGDGRDTLVGFLLCSVASYSSWSCSASSSENCISIRDFAWRDCSFSTEA